MNILPITIISALLFTLAILVLGYISFGLIPMLVFTSGFLGGFVLWMIFPSHASWTSIRTMYWLALALFILHRIEEKWFGFFAELSSITGVSTPDILSPQIILLSVVSVGAWLLVPYLIKRGYHFGYYLAWTFFAALGVTELAHFLVFPFLTGEQYGYFPGMASVVLLAPVAWWGMYRLAMKKTNICI